MNYRTIFYFSWLICSLAGGGVLGLATVFDGKMFPSPFFGIGMILGVISYYFVLNRPNYQFIDRILSQKEPINIAKVYSIKNLFTVMSLFLFATVIRYANLNNAGKGIILYTLAFALFSMGGDFLREAMKTKKVRVK